MAELERGAGITPMIKFWIFASVAALGVGTIIAWRVWRFRDHPELHRFSFAISFGLAIWIVTALCLFDGAVRFGVLMATLAVYLPALAVALWNMRREKF
jgi:phosphatidylserine synthase